MSKLTESNSYRVYTITKDALLKPPKAAFNATMFLASLPFKGLWEVVKVPHRIFDYLEDRVIENSIKKEEEKSHYRSKNRLLPDGYKKNKKSSNSFSGKVFATTLDLLGSNIETGHKIIDFGLFLHKTIRAPFIAIEDRAKKVIDNINAKNSKVIEGTLDDLKFKLVEELKQERASKAQARKEKYSSHLERQKTDFTRSAKQSLAMLIKAMPGISFDLVVQAQE